MSTLLNAQERTEADFRMLFEVVDGRFRFLGAGKAGKMSILEAVWEGGTIRPRGIRDLVLDLLM
jgi:hypothetical protein